MESVLIEERKRVVLKGATKVALATTTQTVVEIGNLNIVITGNKLEVTKLDLENKEVNLSGEISSFKYTNKTEKTPFFKRLFK